MSWLQNKTKQNKTQKTTLKNTVMLFCFLGYKIKFRKKSEIMFSSVIWKDA